MNNNGNYAEFGLAFRGVCDDIVCMTNVIRRLHRKGVVKTSYIEELNHILDLLDILYEDIEQDNKGE